MVPFLLSLTTLWRVFLCHGLLPQCPVLSQPKAKGPRNHGVVQCSCHYEPNELFVLRYWVTVTKSRCSNPQTMPYHQAATTPTRQYGWGHTHWEELPVWEETRLYKGTDTLVSFAADHDLAYPDQYTIKESTSSERIPVPKANAGKDLCAQQ